MKLLLNGDQELATIDLDVDSSSGVCLPKIDGLGYHVEGPAMEMSLVKDEETDGLRLNMALPGITAAALVIETEDVKKLKGLMNKDAMKFMIKALM